MKYGAGIGLSLVKEFAELLNGKIGLESTKGIGSTFILTLPVGIPELQSEHISAKNIDKKPVLVIVDDQAEIRLFIKEIFDETFFCVEAADGNEGWSQIINQKPELIISDVMMPNCNGFELCSKVRGNIETSHIPFILLTAKTGDEAELNALECSADTFVSKPFNEKLLRLRVDKLVEQRKKLREKYFVLPEQKSAGLALNPVDKEFIDKLEKTITKEIDNTEFGVEILAQSVALSTSGVYRKIKSLTGLSPVEFIRTFRLKKAAILLKETSRSVAEIADQTGFGTQKYFSRCFKEQFGISPLNYRKR